MKKFIIIFTLLFSSMVSANPADKLGVLPSELSIKMKLVTNYMAKSLPVQVDSVTVWDSVILLGNHLLYQYTVDTTDPEMVDVLDAANYDYSLLGRYLIYELEPTLTMYACNNEVGREFLDAGGVARYIYKTEKGIPLGEAVITQIDCIMEGDINL